MTKTDEDSMVDEDQPPASARIVFLPDENPVEAKAQVCGMVATGRVVFHPMEQQGDNIPFVKGEVQPLEYRDINFARAFCLLFLAVILIAVIYGPYASKFIPVDSTTISEDDTFSLTAFLIIVLVSLGAAAVGISGFLTLMMNHTDSVLKVSFFAAPALLLAFGVALFILDSATSTKNSDPNANDDVSAGSGVIFLAVIFAAVSAWVYSFYLPFVPFAVSTLQVAGMAVRANRGLHWLTAVMPLCLGGWFLLWCWAIVGVSVRAGYMEEEAPNRNDEDNDDNTGSVLSGLVLVVLVFAFYWTRHVIINVFHTTTAGTVGAWWFSPLADPSFCSMTVVDSLHRSLTYSFGSICFGSLVVALLQTLEHMARSARRNRNAALLSCILECLLHVLRRWVEYFTSWAFCYVGLYGYDFWTAGKNVKSLFKSKGWSTFASDRLVFRVLYFANLSVAILSGGAACLADVVAGPLLPILTDDDGDEVASRWLAFLIGFLLGSTVSHTALFVVESAVRTVIICFAESPAEFEQCHPGLCQLMREGWAAAYPNQWEACPIVWATPTHQTGNPLEQRNIPTATAIA